MNTLYLAWQDSETRCWYPIGRLTRVEDVYRFVYLQGACRAQEEAKLRPLVSFPDWRRTYESPHLFPLFSNRVMPQSRPEYESYVQWLRLEGKETDPMAFLAHSGGRRVTDAMEVFAPAKRHLDGSFTLYFHVHGLRHMAPDSIRRVETLAEGDTLLAAWDAQNEYDENAVTLRTVNKESGDLFTVGFCPRYLSGEVLQALRNDRNSCRVRVAAVNLPPAPMQIRLLCLLEFRATAGVMPFSSPDFNPLVPQPDDPPLYPHTPTPGN